MPDEIIAEEVAATEAAAAVEPVPTEPVDGDAAALAAFDAGVAEVTGEVTPAVTTAADVAAAAAEAKTDDVEAHAPPAAGGAPLTIDHAKKDDPGKIEPEAAKVDATADPETDAAVTELGLKGKAETRFREMSSTIREQATQLEPLRAEAERARKLDELILSSKSTPDQFGQAIGYLTHVNSGDPKMMGAAFDFMLNELQSLGKRLGREVPGLVDPIADHPDLAQAVQFGEINRATALELAQRRVTEQRNAERAEQTSQKATQQREHDQGIQAVTALSERLKSSDPQFDAKLKVLAPVLDSIRQTVPPAQWAEKIEGVYKQLSIPAPAPVAAPPAPVRPPVGAMPLRATGTSSSTMARSLKGADEMDAFNLGLESVR